MNKRNDMSTGKLKVSHLRGATAIKVCAKVSQVLKDAIKSFYKEHISNLITGDNDQFFPLITITNQSDLVNFLKPWQDGKKTSGHVYSSTPVEQFPQRKFNDFILLFDDTIRIEFELSAEKYEYKYVPFACTWVSVYIHAICIDRQKFLDALDIEPELDIPEYVDILGNRIYVGDIVCITARETTQLYIDKVKKLTPYSIVLENGGSIAHKSGYDNRIVVVNNSCHPVDAK